MDRATDTGARWPVMVLAHNEEPRIVTCLDSLFDGEPGGGLEVFVMANGCTDRTEDVVREYAARRPEVHLVSIALGDKCNAWNVFVHETARTVVPDRDVYFFVDGDCRIVPGSLTRLAEGLRANPHAHAASAPPASGRSMESDRRELLENRGLVANLYALRGSFVCTLREKRVRLPLGLEGDDGLLGALIKWDLDPAERGFDDRRIEPRAEAGFVFDSMSVWDPAEWRGYWRRAVRYGRRLYEFRLLAPRLKKLGVQGLPGHISELYRDSANLRLIWDGLYTIPNWVALRMMRKHAK
jgi:glycosyltransferase involved in cell wall biosynthesis